MTTFGPYGLEEVVGRGGSGEVWRASRAEGQPPVVALKRLIGLRHGPAAFVERLRQEVAVLRALDHPNIVSLVEVLEVDGECGLAMDLAEGGSLLGLLARRGALPPAEVAGIVAPIADALAAAHGCGVRHGAVTPANILLTGAGVPLLGDFGVSGGGCAGSPDATAATAIATVVAPERRAGAGPDRADDVWALASVARRALVGERPSPGWRPAGEAEPGGDDLLVLLDQVIALPRADQLTAAAFGDALRAAVPAELVRVPDPMVDLDRRERRLTAPPTRPYGPPPPVALPSSRPRSRTAAAGVVVVLLALGALATTRATGSARVGGSVAVAVPRVRSRACPMLPPLAAPAGASRLSLDLAGGGCAVPLVWRSGTAEVHVPGEAEARRYDFAAADAPSSGRLRGGWLLVGDWDCDGADGVAYYEPTTGTVHYFDVLPRTGRLRADRQARIGRGLRPWVRAAGACDTVEGDRPGSGVQPGPGGGSRVGAVGGPG